MVRGSIRSRIREIEIILPKYKKCDKMVAVRELIAAIFLVSPCVRKELPVAGHVDTKVCKRSCWRTILRINRDRT